MPAPSTALTTLRPDLQGCFQEYDLEMAMRGYIAHQVLPVLETERASGTFGKVTIESLLQQRSVDRNPGGGYNRGDFQFTEESFATKEYGSEAPIDDKESKLYSDYFSYETLCAVRAYHALLEAAERRAAALLFNATTFAAMTADITHEWDDATNATPIVDVEAAVQAIWGACGIWPNALILNRKVFRNLRQSDEIVDRISSSGAGDKSTTTRITIQQLAECFDLPYIFVAGSPKNTATEGQDVSIAPIWSDEYAMVCSVATSQDIRQPCVGRTFHWDGDGSIIGGTFETYREEQTRGDVVRVRHECQEKLLYLEAAYLLGNVTTI